MKARKEEKVERVCLDAICGGWGLFGICLEEVGMVYSGKLGLRLGGLDAKGGDLAVFDTRVISNS